jgi:zinc transport system substrate-binding protein
VGCADTGAPSEEETILAAFYPLTYAVERIADPATRVRNLTPPGVEPHDFELSGRDVEDVANAEMVLYLGHGFQPALESAVEAADAHGVDLLDGLELVEEQGHGHDRGAEQRAESEAVDPHVWLDPLLYARIVERIGEELGRPEAARSLVAELQELHLEFRTGLADCVRREIVTSHAAFGYLARRYDLEQIAIGGLSPEAEPPPRALREFVEEVREHGATTVFFETLVSARLATTVAREVGAETAALNPLEGLTQDELAAGADYLSVMRDNLETLQRALECR